MSPATHFLTGWVFASAFSLNQRERAIVTFACVVPDVDGLGVVVDLATRQSQHPTDWFASYHHSLHTLLFGFVVAAISFAIANDRWRTSIFAFLAFHLHLLEDLLGSRGPDGYQWPIPYLAPFSRACDWTGNGQWALNAWPNFAITITLLIVTFYLTWSKGVSPLQMVSPSADARFVATLRERVPIVEK